MRGNHDNGMCFQTMQLIAVTVAMVFVLCVTAGTIGALAKADDGSYMLQSSSATELMGDFGVICFDTLYAQTHLHSNFITKTLSASSNSGLRNSYGVYEEFYFENAERMCGCVSDAGTDMLYTGAEVRRADGGEIYIRMNDGSETKLDSPANVRSNAEIAEDGEYSKYADMEDIQRKFIDYSQKLRSNSDTEGTVIVDITDDMNNRSVLVNGGGLHVVSMNYSQLSASTNPIYFEFPDYDGDTVLLMNIDLAGIQDAVLGDLILGSKSDAKANDNGNYYNAYNRMYFNFYDSSAADGQFGGSITFAGRGFGTVIAPEAAVNLGHNWDGCVVSEVFSNGGEFHRVPGTDFPDEEPTTEGTTTEDTTTEDTTTEDTTTEDTTTEDTTTEDTTTEDTTTEDTTTEDTTTEDTTTEDTTTEDTTTEDTTTEDTTTEDTTTEGTTTEDTTTEDTTTEDTTTEDTTTEDTTTEDTTTEDTTTEDTTTEDTTTEDTTTEDTTTEDTTTEDTTTEDTTTESTTGITTENTSTETATGTTTESTTEHTTWSTTGTTITMTTTRSTPPVRHPDTGDRMPVKEVAGVIALTLVGSAGILIYKKLRK